MRVAAMRVTRVGVRGLFQALRLAEAPPHPESARKRANSDLSPQAGRGDARSLHRCLIALASLLFVTPALADTIYVSNEQDNTISVIDSASLSVTATIEVGRRPRGIALSA